MLFKRGYFIIAGAAVLASSALGSENNNGIPEYSAAANGSTTLAAFSAGISGNNGSGSGALYDVDTTTVGGVNAVDLCLASADHVTSGQNSNLMSVSLHQGANLFTLNNTNSTIMYRARGNQEDLSWVGVQILQTQVTATQWAYLNALTAVNGMISAYNPAMGDQLTNFGFGRTGKYLWRDTAPDGSSVTNTGDTFTPGLQANGHTYTALGFEWFRGDGAAYGYGTDRSTNTVADGAFNYVSGAYNYNSVRWTFTSAAGTGQINSGDSGGAIYFDGDIVGINTYAQGTVIQTDGAGNATQEDFLYGQKGGGLAFSNADIKWLNSQCVPEPSALLILGFGGMAVLLRRRDR